MLESPTISKVFGDAVTGPGPLRARHAATFGIHRESYGFTKLFCSVLLGDWQDPAGRHGRSFACPQAPPFAAQREMLKFPRISRFSEML